LSLRALTSTGIDWARATGERTAGIPRAYLVNMTSLKHEWWKRTHPEFCRTMGIR